MEELRRIQPTEPHHPRGFWGRYGMYVWVVVGVTVAIGVTALITLVAVGVVKPKEMAGKLKQKLARPGRARVEIVSGDGSEYFAVFLTNNQIYFGKLADQDGNYLRLKEVFYLRAQRQLQPPVEEDEKGSQPKQQIQLIKLGSELHGPVDEIQFNQDNVLFIERLKKDSRVVQGIVQYNAEKTNTLE